MTLDRANHDNPPEQTTAEVSAGPIAAAFGAVIGGLAALSCCVAPLVFVIAGISGAWIANLTALSPYQPLFVAVAVTSVAYGYWTAHRTRRACAPGALCAKPLPRRLIDTGLWAGTGLVVIALSANYAAPYFL